MKQGTMCAFIFEKDQFFRLSLSKILKKYGFDVVEIGDFSELEGRKKDVEEGMVLADVEIDVLERWLPLIRKWNDISRTDRQVKLSVTFTGLFISMLIK